VTEIDLEYRLSLPCRIFTTCGSNVLNRSKLNRHNLIENSPKTALTVRDNLCLFVADWWNLYLVEAAEESQTWPQSKSDWHEMGQIRDILRSHFSAFSKMY